MELSFKHFFSHFKFKCASVIGKSLFGQSKNLSTYHYSHRMSTSSIYCEQVIYFAYRGRG